MKKTFSFMVLAMVLAPVLVFAQDMTAPIGDIEALQKILAVVTGKDLAGMSLVAAIVQAIMYALRSSFVVKLIGETNAKYRLAAVLVLSYAGGIVTLMGGGLGFVAAFMHSTSLAAFQVLVHQLYSLYLEAKKK